MDIKQILFGQLLTYQYVGLKIRNKILFTKEQIQMEINRRLEIAKNNYHLNYQYQILLKYHHP